MVFHQAEAEENLADEASPEDNTRRDLGYPQETYCTVGLLGHSPGRAQTPAQEAVQQQSWF